MPIIITVIYIYISCQRLDRTTPFAFHLQEQGNHIYKIASHYFLGNLSHSNSFHTRDSVFLNILSYTRSSIDTSVPKRVVCLRFRCFGSRTNDDEVAVRVTAEDEAVHSGSLTHVQADLLTNLKLCSRHLSKRVTPDSIAGNTAIQFLHGIALDKLIYSFIH